MDATPDLATIAGLIGDRARATMLMCLMSGRALTATELARAAKVTKQTASSHLSKLTDGGLLAAESVGRHRYFKLADHQVGQVIERLMTLAGRAGVVHVDTGPLDPAMRKARTCYDHLAGDMGVLVFDSLRAQRCVRAADDQLVLTEAGEQFCADLGVDVRELERTRRPMCLSCLDWSARRHHLAGAVGAALLDRFLALGWARVRAGTRVVSFSAVGERSLRACLERRVAL